MTRVTIPLVFAAAALTVAGCTHAPANRTTPTPAAATGDARVAAGCALARTLDGTSDLIDAGATISRVHTLTVDAPHEVQADAEILFEDWQSAQQAPADMRASANYQLAGPLGMLLGACEGSGY